MDYRIATKQDIPVMCRIRKQQLVDEGIAPDKDIDEELYRFFEEKLSDGSLVEWLLDNKGEVIATAAILFIEFPPTFTNAAGVKGYVTNMYTSPDHRGTGIEALIETVGAEGTIMMPTQSWKNLDPEDGVHGDIPEEYWQVIRENWPVYDKHLTPTNTMGAVAEMFRLWPGTIRSDHPARSVSAWGRYAEYLVSHHDLSNIFGEGSPIGKLYELDGTVLLIGVDYDKNTSLHLADVRAEYPGKHTCTEHSAVLEDGIRFWKAYETLFVDGEDFKEIGMAYEEKHSIQRGLIGGAELRHMKSRELVDFAVEWMEKNR